MVRVSGLTATLVLGAAALLVNGCVVDRAAKAPREPLAKIIEANGYIPFEIPREDWGPGTVVTFVDGHERILAFDKECFDLAEKKLANSTGSQLLSGKFTIDRSNTLDLSLARAFGEGVDVSAALKDNRVRNVTYAFSGENENVVSIRTLKSRVQQLHEAKQDDCLNEIFSSKAVVLERVLGVGGVDYSFQDQQGTTLNLDAAMLDQVGLKGQAGGGRVGAAALSSKRPLFLGYRAYQFKSRGGFDSSELEVTEVSRKDVEQLRTESSQR